MHFAARRTHQVVSVHRNHLSFRTFRTGSSRGGLAQEIFPEPISSTRLAPGSDEAGSHTPLEPPCYTTFRSMGAKGVETCVTRAVPAFTRIISDEPLMAMSRGEDLPELWQRYMNLPSDKQKLYMNLHRPHQPERDKRLIQKLKERGIDYEQSKSMAHAASIFQANAFNVSGGLPSAHTDGKPVHRALFPNVARINHSCVPTAHTNYNPITNRMTVHTLRDLDYNSRIEISYFNMLFPLAERQAKAASWGFVCRCPACDIGPGHARHEEARRRVREIEALHLRLVRAEITDVEEIGRVVDQIDEMATIVREEVSLTPQLPFAYEYGAVARMVAFEATKDKELLARIMELLKRAMATEIAITGLDSPATARRREKVVQYEQALAEMSKA